MDNDCLSGTLHGPALFLLKRLRYLSLNLNKLHGALPSQLGSMSSLTYLSLHNNGFEAELPPLAPKLQTLHLQCNSLVGTLAAFADLTALSSLQLNNNYFVGTLPHANLTLLKNLDVSTNQLVGELDGSYLPGLTRLHADGNFFHTLKGNMSLVKFDQCQLTAPDSMDVSNCFETCPNHCTSCVPINALDYKHSCRNANWLHDCPDAPTVVTSSATSTVFLNFSTDDTPSFSPILGCQTPSYYSSEEIWLAGDVWHRWSDSRLHCNATFSVEVCATTPGVPLFAATFLSCGDDNATCFATVDGVAVCGDGWSLLRDYSDARVVQLGFHFKDASSSRAHGQLRINSSAECPVTTTAPMSSTRWTSAATALVPPTSPSSTHLSPSDSSAATVSSLVTSTAVPELSTSETGVIRWLHELADVLQGLGTITIVMIVVGVICVLALVVIGLGVCLCRKRRDHRPNPDPRPRPGPDPIPNPDPRPRPGPDPIPNPDPSPRPGPDPIPNPDPNPRPGPDPIPNPDPIPPTLLIQLTVTQRNELATAIASDWTDIAAQFGYNKSSIENKLSGGSLVPEVNKSRFLVEKLTNRGVTLQEMSNAMKKAKLGGVLSNLQIFYLQQPKRTE